MSFEGPLVSRRTQETEKKKKKKKKKKKTGGFSLDSAASFPVPIVQPSPPGHSSTKTDSFRLDRLRNPNGVTHHWQRTRLPNQHRNLSTSPGPVLFSLKRESLSSFMFVSGPTNRVMFFLGGDAFWGVCFLGKCKTTILGGWQPPVHFAQVGVEDPTAADLPPSSAASESPDAWFMFRPHAKAYLTLLGCKICSPANSFFKLLVV